jgi:hypothetical protein
VYHRELFCPVDARFPFNPKKLASRARQRAVTKSHASAAHEGTRGQVASVRHPSRDHFVAVPSINSEISIEGEYLGCAVDLRESNETRISQ